MCGEGSGETRLIITGGEPGEAAPIEAAWLRGQARRRVASRDRHFISKTSDKKNSRVTVQTTNIILYCDICNTTIQQYNKDYATHAMRGDKEKLLQYQGPPIM